MGVIILYVIIDNSNLPKIEEGHRVTINFYYCMDIRYRLIKYGDIASTRRRSNYIVSVIK